MDSYENMTYKEFIQSVIDTRGLWSIPDDLIIEKHHIIPVCIGGEGDILFENGNYGFYKNSTHPNCIYLTPAEHFIAHKLLALENPDNYDLLWAWHRLLYDGRRDTPISENEYLILRELCR